MAMMVSDHSPSCYAIKYATAFANQSQTFCLYADLWGFRLQSNPVLAPIDTRKVVHQRTTQHGRTTFADHGVMG
jgi:hypothetical protein